MLGRHHLMLSMGAGTALVIPWLTQYDLLVLLMIVGVAIGSLIPDVDAEDAAIFHGELRGLSGDIGDAINNSIAPIFPIFGYVTEYLIYKPMVFVYSKTLLRDYNITEKHRGLLHSWIGITTATIMTGLYLTPILIWLEMFNPFYLAGFLAAYFLGCFLHLLEDSCTKTGVTFNYPFSSKKLHGQITTTAKPEDTKWQRHFIIFHGAVIGGIFVVGHTNQYNAEPLQLTGAATILLIISWAIFVKGIARAKYE